jgi:prophage antirepressor-like protein
MITSYLQSFRHDQFGQIRSIDAEGNPWFVARDVATALGYRDTVNAIKTHCKGVVKRHLPSNGGKQECSTIPESDLYRLILRSKLPSAEAFQDWVTMEVLPAIRKTGAYSAVPPTDDSITRLSARVQALEQALIQRLSLAPTRIQRKQLQSILALPVMADYATSVARWIIEECRRTADCKRSLYGMMETYNDWAQDAGQPTVSVKRFGMILTQLGIPKIRRPQGMFVGLDVNQGFE